MSCVTRFRGKGRSGSYNFELFEVESHDVGIWEAREASVTEAELQERTGR